MATSPDPPRASRPGGRTARNRRAVLDTAVEVLVGAGLDGFSVTAVARRSGVDASTIYRRWGSREALVVEALTEHVGDAVPITATGDLRADVRALLDHLTRFYATPVGRLIGTLAMAPLADPGAEEVRRRLWDLRLRMVEDVVGGVTGVDRRLAAEIVLAPLHLRTCTLGGSVDDDVLDVMTAVVVAGLGALRPA